MSSGFFCTIYGKGGVIIMYGHLFNPNLAPGAIANTQVKQDRIGTIGRQQNMATPSSNDIGAFLNEASSNLPSGTNEYMLKQKLRNSGLYSKLKNKAIFSVESLPHAALNSGIL
jgi:hypothetical protein